jgi:DNA-binding HxlR family transcriptional regulator
LGAEQERHDAYKDLQKSIRGITNMMLTKSSRELEAFGIVRREQFPEVPPRVSIR